MPYAGDEPDWDALSPHEVEVELAAGGRCSALVKVRCCMRYVRARCGMANLPYTRRV
jgi:hypothetical protein